MNGSQLEISRPEFTGCNADINPRLVEIQNRHSPLAFEYSAESQKPNLIAGLLLCSEYGQSACGVPV